MKKQKNVNEAFNVLSMKEEAKLSDPEKQVYYEKLREFLLNRKLQMTTKGALIVAPKLKKMTEKIVKPVTKILAGGKVSKIVGGVENVPDGPVIFAANHQGIMDGFVWIEGCPKHAVIVHSAETNKLLLTAQLNTGLVLVTKDKMRANDRLQAKLDMMSILLKGHSIFICPENAWNLSPNKLHLPLYWGIVELAKKTGKPIVPLVINYVYDTSEPKERITRIEIRYGRPIYVGIEDEIDTKLNEYSDAISTIRWEFIEQQGIYKRSDVSDFEYINFLKGNLANLNLGKIDIKRERDSIYGSKDDFYVFHHLNDVPFDEKGNLLETEEWKRLKMINAIHGI